MVQYRKAFLCGIVILVVAAMVASCTQDPPPETVVVLQPTWTPTPVLATATSYRLSTPVILSQPTAESTPGNEMVDFTKTPTQSIQETPVAPTKTPVPTKPPVLQTPTIVPASAQNGRIDEVGPVAVATVAPLAFGAGMPPTRLLIPALNLDTPVETMGWKVIEDAKGQRSEWEVVDFAAGHHINSAFPGEAGNVVLSGHNNIAGAVFQSVCVIGEPGVDFGLGDEMILLDEIGRRFAYQVNGWHRLQEANASIAQRRDNAHYLNPTTDAQLTLVTCWPPHSNTHRVVVTGLLAGIE